MSAWSSYHILKWKIVHKSESKKYIELIVKFKKKAVCESRFVPLQHCTIFYTKLFKYVNCRPIYGPLVGFGFIYNNNVAVCISPYKGTSNLFL